LAARNIALKSKPDGEQPASIGEQQQQQKFGFQLLFASQRQEPLDTLSSTLAKKTNYTGKSFSTKDTSERVPLERHNRFLLEMYGLRGKSS